MKVPDRVLLSFVPPAPWLLSVAVAAIFGTLRGATVDNDQARAWLETHGGGKRFNLLGNVNIDKNGIFDNDLSPREISDRSKSPRYENRVPCSISESTAKRIRNREEERYQTRNVMTYFIVSQMEDKFSTIVSPDRPSSSNVEDKLNTTEEKTTIPALEKGWFQKKKDQFYALPIKAFFLGFLSGVVMTLIIVVYYMPKK